MLFGFLGDRVKEQYPSPGQCGVKHPMLNSTGNAQLPNSTFNMVDVRRTKSCAQNFQEVQLANHSFSFAGRE